MKKLTALLAFVLLISVSLFILSSCGGEKAESKAESKTESKSVESKAESKATSKPAESKAESKEESKPDIFTYEIDRTKTKTNVAAGKGYVLSKEADSAYPDEENKTLTDGTKHGETATYSDAIWAGFKDVATAEVIIDLGEKVEAIADFEASLLRDSGAGVSMPSNMKVYVSEDGKTYHEAGSLALSNDDVVFEGDGSVVKAGHIAKIALEKGVKAQFVKFEFTLSGWLFISELEVSVYK